MEEFDEVKVARKKKIVKIIIIVAAIIVVPLVILFSVLSGMLAAPTIQGVQDTAKQSIVDRQADAIFRNATALAVLSDGDITDAQIDTSSAESLSGLQYDATTNQLSDGDTASTYICVTGPQSDPC